MPAAAPALLKQDEWMALIVDFQRTLSEAEAASGDT
jgi:hypothetical protein